MKTIKEFIKEIYASVELRKAFGEIKDKVSLEEFLKQNGCPATADEFVEYVKAQSEGEIGDDAAEEVAGGLSRWVASELKASVQSFYGTKLLL